jgi:hypothetical protein
MSWFDLLVKLAPPSAMDRARQIAAEQRAAADEKRRRSLLKLLKPPSASLPGGGNPDKSIARRPIGVRGGSSLLAPVNIRFLFTGDQQVTLGILPAASGAEESLFPLIDQSAPAVIDWLSTRPDGTVVTCFDMLRKVIDRNRDAIYVLPHVNDIGLVVYVRDLRWTAIDWRGGCFLVRDSAGAPDAGYFGPDRSSYSSLGLTPANLNVYGSHSREVRAFVYNTTTVRELTPPNELLTALEEINPPGDAAHASSNGPVRHYTVAGDPFEDPDVARYENIIASPFIIEQEVDNSALLPWRMPNPAITGYGIQNIYSNTAINGWGSGVYSYLNNSYPLEEEPSGPNPGVENLDVEDASAFLAALDINAPWLHSFNIENLRDHFYELTTAPTGSIEDLSSIIPERTAGEDDSDNPSPWVFTGVKSDRRINYSAPSSDFFRPYTHIANNNFPAYNASQLTALGFNLADLNP